MIHAIYTDPNGVYTESIKEEDLEEFLQDEDIKDIDWYEDTRQFHHNHSNIGLLIKGEIIKGHQKP